MSLSDGAAVHIGVDDAMVVPLPEKLCSVTTAHGSGESRALTRSGSYRKLHHVGIAADQHCVCEEMLVRFHADSLATTSPCDVTSVVFGRGEIGSSLLQ
jgi:hypothetical protein